MSPEIIAIVIIIRFYWQGSYNVHVFIQGIRNLAKRLLKILVETLNNWVFRLDNPDKIELQLILYFDSDGHANFIKLHQKEACPMETTSCHRHTTERSCIHSIKSETKLFVMQTSFDHVLTIQIQVNCLRIS